MIWVLFCMALLLGAICLGKSMAKDNNRFNIVFFGVLSIFYLVVAIFIAIGGGR